MKIIIRLLAFCLLCACTSTPKVDVGEQPPLPPSPVKMDLAELQKQLGLERDQHDLGYAEKDFDGCRMNLTGDPMFCGARYLAVVHFRLMCRDTVETTTRVPSSLRPLQGHMEWRLNGKRGFLKTDEEGYGQVKTVSRSPSKSQRFMLIIGKKSLGVEASEVSQIIVPSNWCARGRSS